MPYAIVAPGLSLITDDYQDVERVKMLYPYPKFRKFARESECVHYISCHENKHSFDSVCKYGDIFEKTFIQMEYFINDDSLCYNFNTSNFGYTRIYSDVAEVTYHNNKITARIPNMYVERDSIIGNLAAIYNGLYLLGPYVDVDVVIRNHAMFYALMTYRGNDRSLNRALTKIHERSGGLSVTLKLHKPIEENEEDMEE